MRRTIRPHTHSHAFEVRRKAVQLCLEEKFPAQQVAREMGVGLSTLGKLVRDYREQGEGGLQSQPRRGGSRQHTVCAHSSMICVANTSNHDISGIVTTDRANQ